MRVFDSRVSNCNSIRVFRVIMDLVETRMESAFHLAKYEIKISKTNRTCVTTVLSNHNAWKTYSFKCYVQQQNDNDNVNKVFIFNFSNRSMIFILIILPAHKCHPEFSYQIYISVKNSLSSTWYLKNVSQRSCKSTDLHLVCVKMHDLSWHFPILILCFILDLIIRYMHFYITENILWLCSWNYY